MCDYIEEYNEYLNRIKKRKDELNQQLSNADLEEQDLLHLLEFEKFNGITLIKIAKKLKDIRVKRREIKNEWEQLNKIHTKLGKEIPVHNEKSYKYRTDVAKEFLVKTK